MAQNNPEVQALAFTKGVVTSLIDLAKTDALLPDALLAKVW
jgi:hypothetical protein